MKLTLVVTRKWRLLDFSSSRQAIVRWKVLVAFLPIDYTRHTAVTLRTASHQLQLRR